MTRSYGRTATAMWRDQDFRRLSSEARFVYTMLFTQPDITAAGVLGLTVARWAGNTGYDVATVRKALGQLDLRGYIVVDYDTEEVFVRSFCRHDGGANNEKRQQAIADSAGAVMSPHLRVALAREMNRLGIAHGITDDTPDRESDIPSDAPCDAPSDIPSDTPCDAPCDALRVVVTKGDQESNPQPTTHNPAATRPRSDLPKSLEAAFAEFWAAYPRRTGKLDAERKFTLAVRRVPPDEIVAAAVRYATSIDGTDPRFIPHPATWLHQGRWDDEPATATAVTGDGKWE